MSAYFPQLQTGTMTQFPIKRKRMLRVIENELEGGQFLGLVDANASQINWQLSYEGISDGEADTLTAFFESMEGSLGTFVFADPGANLLVWSDALDNAAWTRPSLLSVANGASDPSGGTLATDLTNGSVTGLSLSQNVNIPGSLTATFSVYVRSLAQGTLQLARTDGNASFVGNHQLTPGWQRASITSSLAGANGYSTFSVSVEAGAQVSVYGMQAVAQPAPAKYVPTAGSSGLYVNTRFASDDLSLVRTGVNRNSCQFELVSAA